MQKEFKERKAVKSSSKKYLLVNYMKSKGTILVLILLLIYCTIAFGATFFSWSNISNIFRQISWFGIAAIGVNLCILAGGRDVSVGANAMFTGMVFAYLVSVMQLNILLSLLITLCIGPVIGLVNGFIVNKLRLNAMIATLTISWILQSFALLLYNNNTIPIRSTDRIDRVFALSRGDLFGIIPIPFAIFILLVWVFDIFARRTKTGRAIYAVGGDTESAGMMGVNVERTRMITHLICSILACISGLFLIGRTGLGDPTSCSTWGFTMMSVVMIGGTRMHGGIGDIRGVIVGVLIYGLINNMLSLYAVTKYWQELITGLIMLIAVLSQEKAALQ